MDVQTDIVHDFLHGCLVSFIDDESGACRTSHVADTPYALSHMDAPETNPKLGKMILEVVQNQIRDNDPPETRQTFERLKSEGYSADEAKRLISTAVTVELFHIMRDRQPFSRDRFVWNLAHLPREPWDEDGKEFYVA